MHAKGLKKHLSNISACIEKNIEMAMKPLVDIDSIHATSQHARTVPSYLKKYNDRALFTSPSNFL